MSEPVAFISRFHVKDGKADELRQRFRESAAALQAEKPRTVVFLSYLDEGATDVSILHVFPDAASMDVHFEGAAERASDAYQYIEPRGWELYGPVSEASVATLRAAASSAGVSIALYPEFVTGFLRPSASA
jgi:quinol monooxygenase YgiN